jgi:hypothetical protein
VPAANVAAEIVPKVSSFAMILPTTFTVGSCMRTIRAYIAQWSYRTPDGIGNRVRSRWEWLQWLHFRLHPLRTSGSDWCNIWCFWLQLHV